MSESEKDKIRWSLFALLILVVLGLCISSPIIGPILLVILGISVLGAILVVLLAALGRG